MAKVRLGRAALEAPVTPKVRLGRAAIEGTAPVGSGKVRLGRAAFEGTAGVTVNNLTAQTVEPETLVTITASLSGGGTPDSYTFRRVSGPSITFIGTGATRTFRAPSGMPPAGAVVVVGVTATIGASTSPEKTATITVLPQNRWHYSDNTWVGKRPVVAV